MQPLSGSPPVDGSARTRTNVGTTATASTSSRSTEDIQREVDHLFQELEHSDAPESNFLEFVQLHCGAKIAGTNYEGSLQVDKYKYWGKILEYAASKGHISPGDHAVLKRPIQDGIEYYTLIRSGKAGSADIHNLIKKSLQEHGTFYLPGGWGGKEGGHAVIMKFALEKDGQVKVTILNRGGGLDYHTQPLLDGKKVKYDCRSMTASFPLENFEGQQGSLLINNLMQLEHYIDDEIPEINPYSADDLYGVLALSGGKQERPSFDPFYATTPQRSGNCSEASFHLMLKDACKQTEGLCDEKQVRHLFFKLKEDSLIGGFKAFRKEAEGDPGKRLLLEHAIEQYAIRTLKLKDILTPEEVMRAEAISRHLTNAMEKLARTPATNKLPEMEEIKLAVTKGVRAAAPSRAPLGAIESRGSLTEDSDYFSSARAALPQVQIHHNLRDQEIPGYLTENLKIIQARMERGGDPVDTFVQIHQLISSLPHGMEEIEGTHKKVWDGLNEKEAQVCFDTIHKLARLAVECGQKTEVLIESEGKSEVGKKIVFDKGKLVEIGYRAYDIAASLAPRIENLHVSKEHGFSLGEEHNRDRQEFADPKSYAVIQQIEDNFRKRNEGKKGEIFSGYVYLGQGDKKFNAEGEYIKKLYGSTSFNLLVAKQGFGTPYNSPTELALEELLVKRNKGKDNFTEYFKMLDLVSLTTVKKGSDIIKKTSDLNEEDTTPYSLAKFELSKLESATVGEGFAFTIHDKDRPSGRTENQVYVKYKKTSPDSPDDIFNAPPDPVKRYGGLPEMVKQELEGIASVKKEAPLQTLAWAGANLDMLSHPEVQRRIEKMLFAYETLPNQIAETPEETFKVIQEVLERGLQHYRISPKNTETFLWLLKMTDMLEGHLRDNLPEGKRSFEGWFDTGKMLDEVSQRGNLTKEQSYSLAQHQMIHLIYYPPTTPADYRSLLKNNFALIFLRDKTAGVSAIDYKIKEVVNQHYSTAIKQLESSSKEERIAFAVGLMHTFVPGSFPKRLVAADLKRPDAMVDTSYAISWLVDHGELTDGIHSIFLDSGKIFKNQKNIIPLDEQIMSQKNYTDYFGTKPFSGVIENGYFRHVSQPYRLVIEENIIGNRLAPSLQYIERQHGDGQWYRLITEPAKAFPGVNLPQWLQSGTQTFWLTCDKAPPTLFIRDKETDAFLYSYTQERGLQVVNGATGASTDRVVMHLNKPEVPLAEAWRQRLAAVETAEHTIIEAKKGKSSLEMMKISFPRLHLDFEMKEIRGKKVLACQQMAGFYLQDPQSQVFASFQGALVLEDGRGKTKVIIPGHPLQKMTGAQKSVGTTTSVANDPEKLLDIRTPYFVFEGTREEPLKKATSPQSALYLSLIYRGEKNYNKALDFLQASACPYSNKVLDWRIAGQTLVQPDNSPEGAAYDLHLGVRMKEHIRKFDKKSEVKNSEGKELADLKDSFLKNLESRQTVYNNNVSNVEADIYQIPERLRLTPAEESVLHFKDLKNAMGLEGSSQHADHPLAKLSMYTRQMDKEGNSTISTAEFTKLINTSETVAYVDKVGIFTKNTNKLLILEMIQGKKELEGFSRHGQLKDLHPKAEEIAAVMVKSIKNLNLEDKNIMEYQPGQLRVPLAGEKFIAPFLIKNYEVILKRLVGTEEERRGALVDLLFLSRNNSESLSENTQVLFESLFIVASRPEAFQNVTGQAPGQLPDQLMERVFQQAIEVTSSLAPQEEKAEGHKESVNSLESKRPACSVTVKVSPPLGMMEYVQEVLPTRHTPFVVGSNPVAVTEKRQLAANTQWPLQQLYERNFTRTAMAPKQAPSSLFSVKDRENMPALARKQMEDYNTGLLEQSKVSQQGYSYTVTGNLASLRQEIEGREQVETKSVASLKQSILSKANKLSAPGVGHPPDAIQAQQRQQLLLQGGQKRKLEFPDILTAFLKQDGAFLQKINPLLTKEDVAGLFDTMLDLYLHEAEKMQLKEAIELLDKPEAKPGDHAQKLGEMLAKQREYDPRKYPLLAVYEGTTGKMLRKDQVDAIVWTIEGVRNGKPEDAVRLLQAFAGFGKTKVLVTIVAMMLAQEGFLPVVANTSNLYNFGKRDLEESLRQAFVQNMEVFEVRVGDDPLNIFELEDLKNNLEKLQEDKKCLLLTPESWHVLNMQYKNAYINKNDSEFKTLEGILVLLTKSGFVIPDEAHLICNSLQEAIKAVGQPQHLSPLEIDLFLKNYQVLLGKTDEAIGSLVNLKKNQQSFVTEEEQLPIIKKALIEASLEYDHLKEGVSRERLKEFLSSGLEARPQWLIELKKGNPDLANLIALQHGFIQGILPHILAQKGGDDYGDSIHKGDLTAAPKHDKQSTTARFSDEYITLALTIQHTHQQGINQEGVHSLLTYLHDLHVYERKGQKIAAPTRADVAMRQLFPDASKAITLDELDFNNKEQQEGLYEALQHSASAESFYLENIALRQIRVFDNKISSTPAEFLSGFKGGLCLTATPGRLETLPVALTRNENNNKLDRASEAETIAAMLAPRNNKVVTVASFEDPKAFFEELIAKDPSLLGKLSYLIDRGGGFRSVDNAAVVKAYMEIAKGVMEGTVSVTGSSKSSQEAQVAVNRAGKDPLLLDGSNLEEAMKQKGVDPSLLASCFYYYSIMETTGVDWPRPPGGSKGLLTVGEEQTATDTIQAAKRNRAFCDDKQSIEWVLSEKMLPMIRKDGAPPSPKEIVTWMIHNEAREQEKKLWLRFQQGVENIFVQHVKGQIAKSKDPFGDPNYETYAKFLTKKAVSDPVDRFHVPPSTSGLEAKRELLNKIILETYQQKLGYTDTEMKTLSEQECADLALLVKQTATLLDTISLRTGEMSAEAVQEQEQVQEQVQLQEQDQILEQEVLRGEGRLRAGQEDYTHKDYSLGDSLFLDSANLKNNKKHHQYAGDWMVGILGSQPSASPIDNEAWREAFPLVLSDQFFIDKGYLRPVRNILVEIDPSTKPPSHKFVALSTEGFAHYKQQLLDKQEQGSKRYVLLSSDGLLMVKGKKNQPTDQEIDLLMKGEGLQKALNTVALLEGRIRDPQAMAEIVKPMGEQGFRNLIRRIRNRQLAETAKIDGAAIRKVEGLCGWRQSTEINKEKEMTRLGRKALPSIPLPRQRSPKGRPSLFSKVSKALAEINAPTTPTAPSQARQPSPTRKRLGRFFGAFKNPSKNVSDEH